MKKTISTWWPVAMLLPIALMFCMHAGKSAPSAMRSEQMNVASVSAELARAISYGLVDDSNVTPAVLDAQKTL
jgi:hypothetical protein